MKLTREQAIDLSIELWEWLAETGGFKHQWSGWEKYGDSDPGCFLCDYQEQKDSSDRGCGDCPYFQKFGRCLKDKSPYDKWDNASTPQTRKKYAKLFLEQLKELKK